MIITEHYFVYVCNCKDRNRDNIVFNSGEESGEVENLGYSTDISYLEKD